MMTMSAAAKVLMPIASVVSKPLMEKLVLPKIESIFVRHKVNKVLLSKSLEIIFEEYLSREYAENSIMNTLVFQDESKTINDLYVPLTLKYVSNNSNIRYTVEKWDDKYLPKNGRIIVTDTAGMGKSTIIKKLFLSCIEESANIPIIIELRKLSSEWGILDEIYSELNAINAEIDKDVVMRLIKKGDFCFFLDGYDEISKSEKNSVTIEIQQFINKASNNLFVLASRPESGIGSFKGFRHFVIQPLELEEAFTLIRKYDSDGKTSAELIGKIKGDVLENIKEFLTNPLLVSLLYKSYDYRPTIPFKKHIFYRQVYDALFEGHDFTKEGAFARKKQSKLDIEDFHRIMRAFGYITSIKIGEVEYDRDQLVALLSETKTANRWFRLQGGGYY